MPGLYEQRKELHLTGGLNSVDPPTELQDNELVQCQNMWYLDGKMSKRPGFFRISDSDIPSTYHLNFLGYDPNGGRLVITNHQEFKIWLLTTADVGGVATQVTNTTGYFWNWLI